MSARFSTLLRNNKKSLIGLAVFFAARAALADYNLVPSGSMNPVIIEGDYILTNKLAYGIRVPFTKTWLKEFEGPKTR